MYFDTKYFAPLELLYLFLILVSINIWQDPGLQRRT